MHIDMTGFALWYIYSSCGPDAHRRVHPAAAERGEKLRRASEQAVHSESPHGHPGLLRDPCRPAHCGKRPGAEIKHSSHKQRLTELELFIVFDPDTFIVS